MSEYPDILDPPPYLTQDEARGWRSFFSGRARVSMRGEGEAAGWWKARGHAYAMGWGSSSDAALPPAELRLIDAAYSAWIDGRQRHQTMTSQVVR